MNATEKKINYHDISLNPDLYQITYKGKTVSLNPKEYELLILFLQYPNYLLSYGMIADCLWDSSRFPSNSTIRSHIKMLRKALREVGIPDSVIQTIRGLGYRFNLKNIENIAPFVTLSILQEFLKVKGIEYLVLDKNFSIRFLSPQCQNYCDYPDALRIGNDLDHAFPELIDFKQELEKVRNKEEKIFTLKGIAREINPQRPEYINIFVISNNPNNSISSLENLLFIFFEDDSEKVILQQRLFQQNNGL
jgi:DNA-binding winged helix-turn-helix (wHTH) protein